MRLLSVRCKKLHQTYSLTSLFLAGYEEIQDQPGDSFYIRAKFDRLGDAGDPSDLRFRKEDILYVDNTMFNNVPGLWRAWVVDEDGHKRQWGTVPSKDK